MAGSAIQEIGGTGGHRRARRVRRAFVAAAAVFAMLPIAGPVDAARGPSATLEQCENGDVSSPQTCDWITGNLGPHNSHWAENDSVPYRLRLGNLSTTGTHTVTIEWDPTKSDEHAFDYVTSFDRTETTADPCDGVSGCTLASPATTDIPEDPNVANEGVTQIPGVFSIWNGAFTDVSAYTTSTYSPTSGYSSDSSTRVTLTFTAAAADPVIAWSGHIADEDDWGPNTAAATISGSPYHMRLIEIDGSGGNQDRSMKVAPGPTPSSITIVKQASPERPREFEFTASDGLADFTLVDDGDDATAPFNSMTFDGLTDFWTVTDENTYDFTETVPAGWELSSISCSTGADVTVDLPNETVSVKLSEGTDVVCTFGNTDLVPTIGVTKTPTPSVIDEPGDDVSFEVTVTNNSTVEAVTLESLIDDPYGDVADDSNPNLESTTCSVPQTIAADDDYTCSFVVALEGDAGATLDDEVTATVEDQEENEIDESATASVDVQDVLPTIGVTKTATPTSLPEPGGNVSFLVEVSNTSPESVTLDSLVDSVYGSLSSASNPKLVASNCAVGASIAAGDTYTCTFTVDIEENYPFTETDTVEAEVHDNEQNTATASASATVTITDAEPVIVVEKTASATTVHAGDEVTYTYVVTTPGDEELLEVELSDDKCSPVDFVDGDTDGDDRLDPGESWTYTCSDELSGTTTNTAVVEAVDDEGNEATDEDSATVKVIDPAIAIDKSADPKSASPGDRVVYTYLVTNPGDAELTDVTVTDDKCAPVTYVAGDTDDDGALDIGETWRYTCEVTVGSDVTSLTNIGTVTAKDPTGATVSADDTETITIVLGAVIERPRTLGVPLPRTGGDFGWWALVGAELIGLGAMLCALARRRRRGAEG